MGHTVWSQRIALDAMIDELKCYGKSLRMEDAKVYNELLNLPLKRIGSISYASSLHIWAFLLLSIALEQQKMISRLEAKHESLAHGRIQEKRLNSTVDEDSG